MNWQDKTLAAAANTKDRRDPPRLSRQERLDDSAIWIIRLCD